MFGSTCASEPEFSEMNTWGLNLILNMKIFESQFAIYGTREIICMSYYYIFKKNVYNKTSNPSIVQIKSI